MTALAFNVRHERLGPLPIVNHFLQRLDMDAVLETYVPTLDRRCTLPYAKGLGVLLRSIIVERQPIYRQQETVQSFAASLFGVDDQQAKRLSDDRIGRALDQLFDADRGALLTAVVTTAGKRFGLRFDQLHNDSTTVRFVGQYRQAKGRYLRGRRAPWITHGHSKDRRPDLKQLLFMLTTSADGGVPVQFRTGDGNTNDSTTHIQTWNTLCEVTGRSDFLYVADSKLCTRQNMLHIDKEGGRLVTVLPRGRQEDGEFRQWIQTHKPDWQRVWDRPNPRRKYGPRDRWWVSEYPIPSQEGWRVIWVYSELLALHQDRRRRENIAGAVQALQDLKQRLANPRTRLRQAQPVYRAIEDILEHFHVKRYLHVQRIDQEDHRYRQQRRGRPSANTSYRRITRRYQDIQWELRDDAIAFDHKSDGMYPLLTNDRFLSPAQVLKAHKSQPTVERRFRNGKSVLEFAPVLLHNEGRIEALFFLYFLALLVEALIERELRRAMEREQIEQLPIYPEERRCKRPTTDQVLRLFSPAQRTVLFNDHQPIQVFDPALTDLQKDVLRLLGMRLSDYQLHR